MFGFPPVISTYEIDSQYIIKTILRLEDFFTPQLLALSFLDNIYGSNLLFC